MKRSKSRSLVFATAVAVLLAVCGIASAQTNAQFVGDVLDPTGAAIPGASVEVTHTATGISRTVAANAVGQYRVYPLNPGTYDITVSATGFKTEARRGVVLEVSATLEVDFSMELGEVSETVEVTGAAPIMQTQEASVGGVISQSQLERMPVNGRNYTRLIVLMPGASDIQRSQARGTGDSLSGTGLVSINGQRSQDNSFTLDGVDNNMMFMNSPGGSPPMDAIQEFKVATNNSAEFGRSAGANVNLAIKSGTRDLHGTAYWYVRNEKFDANPFFNNFEGLDKAPFRQNQYGASVGGPVVLPGYNGRDQTFWFFSWEGFRYRRGETFRLTTPTADLRAGSFAGIANVYDPLTGVSGENGGIVRDPFPNDQVPASRMNESMTWLVDRMLPLPNSPGITRNFVRQESISTDREMFVTRVDHAIGSKDNLFGRVLFQRVARITPQDNPNISEERRYDVNNMALGWNRILTPSSVFEFKFGLNNPHRPSCSTIEGASRGDWIDMFNVTIFDREAWCDPLPSISAQGFTNAGGGFGETNTDHVYQYNSSISWVAGRHSMKAGGGYSWRKFDAAFANPTNGNADFWPDVTGSDSHSNPDLANGHSYATMLLGFPSFIRRGAGIPQPAGRQHAWEFFLQDDWRVSDRLTINFGLRYEFHNKPYDAEDKLGNLWITRDADGTYAGELMWAGVNPLPDPATGEVNAPPRQLGFGRPLMANDNNNFAPRIGLAYRVTDSTVLRTGFGLFYNSTFMQELNDLRKFWPYLPQQEISYNREARPDFVITDQAPPFSSTQEIGGWPQNPENRTPYSQQWNIFIQQQVMENMTLDIGYVGSASKKQIGYTGWNNAIEPSPEPIGPRRLLAASGFTGNFDGGSNVFNAEYNALQFKLNKRFSNGLQFLANYTYGNCMTDQSSLAEGQYMNIYNRRLDWGWCTFGIRHAFKAGYVLELPFGRGRRYGGGWNGFLDAILGGWSVEGLVQLQSGTTSTVLTGTDRANVGRTRERANIVSEPNTGSRGPDRLFNVDAYAMPDRYTWGMGNVGSVHDDGRYVWDVAIAKQFRLREGHALELRSEFFNFPNHTNLVNGREHTITSNTFGTTRGATTERQIQFSLRYRF